jgi:hypothetical protein
MSAIQITRPDAKSEYASGADGIGEFGKAADFSGSGALVNDTLFRSFINYGLSGIQFGFAFRTGRFWG